MPDPAAADPAGNPASNPASDPATAPPVEVSNDFDDYTNGELEAFEEATGFLIADLVGKPIPRKASNALLWLTLRRTRPDATLDDARAMRNSAWVWQPPDPPTAPADAGSSGRAAPPASAPSTG